MEASNLENITSGNGKQEAQQKSAGKTLGNHSDSSSKKQNSGSMTIDELLNSLWNVEGSQLSSIIPNQTELTNNDKTTEQVWADIHGNQPKEQNPNVVGNSNFSQHFSSTVPNQNDSTNDKTMQEVWTDIHGNQPKEQNPNVVGSNNNFSQHQQTVGEITLEDFLVKAGVIQGTPLLSPPTKMSLGPNVSGLGPTLDPKFSYPNSGNSDLQGNGNGNGSSQLPQVLPPNNYFVGETSSNGGNKENYGMQQRKRRLIRDGPMEVEAPVDRRQRRMIKNRESAARSRARKQAYMAELEIELTKLREENERLKRSLEEIKKETEKKEEQEVLEVEPLTKADSTAKKMKTLTRTASLSW